MGSKIIIANIAFLCIITATFVKYICSIHAAGPNKRNYR